MNKMLNIQSSQCVHGHDLAVSMGRAARLSGIVGSVF
jgi:hypothetical protein